MPIQTVEEAREWLQEFMTRINEQDNRITKTPIFYFIRCPKRIYRVDSDIADGETWVGDEGEEYSREELEQRIWEDSKDDGSVVYDAIQSRGVLIESKEDITDSVLRRIAAAVGLEEIGYRDTKELKAPFLTEEAAKRHIAQNKHHYPDGVDTYVDHAWRNPEIKRLYECLGLLVGVPFKER